ncbi:MAG: hybrid sensor histidine kinase/response regulator [Desertifilum sp. SIO1I2]|nr:hybrid sensor histidine kinase/response regulator [Desertifilum sp. SIO1I2]
MVKILVIEDENPVRRNILEFLLNEGFNAIGAVNGSLGIQIAQVQPPDLIVCDIMMAGVDGYAVLDTLRADPRTSTIPFIFLTAKSNRVDFRTGMEKGADDFITKPFTWEELKAAITARLAKQTTVSQLQEKIQELQQLNILKDELINSVSHDLRTPLTNMKIAIKMLALATTPEQKQRYLNILQAECAREINLVNNLLDLQRLESQTYRISLQSLNLGEWLPSAIAPFQSRSGELHLNFRADWDRSLPPLISDPDSLERILAELLNNACKYTPQQGEIQLNVCYLPPSPTTAETEAALFRVSNSAEIPSAALPHIFDKFYRVAGADCSKQGGSGLGLSLVQKLVEQLHGSIVVSSESGWTTFSVYLPNLTQPGLAKFSSAERN